MQFKNLSFLLFRICCNGIGYSNLANNNNLIIFVSIEYIRLINCVIVKSILNKMLTEKLQVDLIEFLSEHITEKRKKLFKKVILERTRYITVVLEDIFQPHNASAVLRSCDCFGVQDVHIIENRNKYTLNPDVAMGSSKWLNLNKYNQEDNNTRSALRNLKSKGYRIVATSPHSDDVELYDLDLEKGKVAIVFGTELTGISEVVKEEADEFLRIPMYGFTESFNISVSAALVLQHLAHQIRKSGVEWELPAYEQNEVVLNWLRTSVKGAPLIEREFFKRKML